MSEQTVRKTALELLVRIGEGGGFSHLLINHAIEKNHFETRDARLLTELVYGTLQRKLTIDYYLEPFLKRKVKPWVKWLLSLAVYQMQFLDRIPDHAVIYESVEIAKKKGHKGIASMVNGVLRNIQRKGVSTFDEVTDPIKRLSVETSHPEWLVKRFVKWYGMDVAKKMCLKNLEPKKVSVRVQPLKISREDALMKLNADGIQGEPSALSEQGIKIKEGNVFQHSLFKDSLTVQDESSMLAGEMMDAEPGMTVLDACSAPGGKTTHIAEKMNNQGKIYAYDLHPKKAKLVEDKAKTLGLTIVEARQADSRQLKDLHSPCTFDRILLDAPCSGLGVLRGKPEIKYQKTTEDIRELTRVQRELLQSVSPLVKEGGKLVYSTCTVDREENELMVEWFLNEHPEFEIDPDFHQDLPDACQSLPGLSEWGLQLFPQDLNTDGFFLTRLRKKGV
ncbi:MAG: 16S rRNA (cytosine(967)-C(5))-methyltransferase RsmB [Bacillaceae bacterium]|nr:16S rRNA (cytosine(967)-C(5))-methyltransferase RsmB [Bacillaceae bacterium]